MCPHSIVSSPSGHSTSAASTSQRPKASMVANEDDNDGTSKARIKSDFGLATPDIWELEMA